MALQVNFPTVESAILEQGPERALPHLGPSAILRRAD